MFTKYLLVWFLLAIVAVINGLVRQATYGVFVSELVAHQISTLTGILATGALVWFVHRFWAIQSASQAFGIGLCWLVMTVAFEFGFGHYVAGHSWGRLLADYNVLNGRVWSLFLIWVAILPCVIFRFTRRAA